MGLFTTLEELLVATADAVRPPERLSVAEAAQKYRWLNNPGSYVGPFKNEKTPYMVGPQDVLQSLDHEAMIFVGPAQTGKALDVETPIATRNGWSVMGALRVGDEVFAPDGTPTRVVFATEFQFGRTCYEIEFDDGTTIVADADHKWAVEDRLSEKARIATTQELKDLGVRYGASDRSRFCIPNPKPLQYAPAWLFLDPYVLGLWLGDGSVRNGYISCGAADVQEVQGNLAKRGWHCAVYPPSPGKTAYALGLRGPDGVPLERYLAALGVGGDNGKYIPEQYLRGTPEQRRELLRGLMDSDGTVGANGRAVAFANTNPRLVEGTRDLLWSLGYKFYATNSRKTFRYLGETKTGKPNTNLCFTAYDMADIFSLSRKRDRVAAHAGKAKRTGQIENRWIREIRQTVSRPVRCIQVDHPSHMFLAGRQLVPTHNTDSLLNWITHSVVCDPADMMVIEKSQTAARDFARRRIAKLLRDTGEVRQRVLPGRTNQSIYDYRFRSGMLLSLSWPTVNELSGKPVGRLWLTDYDRMPDDIDGEGSPFDLARKRATTFRRFGMTVAESSPGRVVDNPKWLPKTPHEAPPTTGILQLYNRGDRRRWLWPCVNCDAYFEPDFSNLRWPDTADTMEAAEACWMECPHCAQEYRHDFDEATGTPGKAMLNARGLWLPDGMKAHPGGIITGTPPKTTTASFWLKGPAATFTDWSQLVHRYLKAMEEFETTGDETALKTTINTDQGLPYTPQGMGSERLPEELRSRARDLGEKVVPEGVRFLVAAVDVQKSRFEVQVMGVGVGSDVWIIDRFKIRKSDRIDEDGERYPVNPAQYPEDWHVLIDNVILKTYPLGDGSGRSMQIKAVGIDSGGREGVTVNAYDFYRHLQRTDGRGLHRRVRLIKGDPKPTAPLVRIDYPDAERKDRKAAARGEIPILFIASNKMKDAANAMLGRTEPGGGMVSFPLWLEDWFYAEMTAETRTAKGWMNPKSYRNEAWDLFNYGLGLCYSKLIRLDLIDWDNPPRWAAEWDENDLVSQDFNKRFENQPKDKYDLAALASTLA